jgi:hypothetical protein
MHATVPPVVDPPAGIDAAVAVSDCVRLVGALGG